MGTCWCLQGLGGPGWMGSVPPEWFAPKGPLGFGLPMGSAKRVGERVAPHVRVLALNPSWRCRSSLLPISVWKENECCSCKIIPNPSCLSSGAGAGARAPAPGAPRCHVLTSSAVPTRTGPTTRSLPGCPGHPTGLAPGSLCCTPQGAKVRMRPPCSHSVPNARWWLGAGGASARGTRRRGASPGGTPGQQGPRRDQGVADCAPTPGAGPCSPQLLGVCPPLPRCGWCLAALPQRARCRPGHLNQSLADRTFPLVMGKCSMSLSSLPPAISN